MPVLKYKDPADGQWKPVPLGNVLDMIRRAGDRMTGPLLVPEATEADQVMPLGQADARYVNVTGDTMTGYLKFTGGGVDVQRVLVGNRGAEQGQLAVDQPGMNLAIVNADNSAMGTLGIAAPTAGHHAATKGYVDNHAPMWGAMESWEGKDLNALMDQQTRIVNGVNMGNAPAAIWMFVLHLAHVNLAGYCTQLALGMTGGPNIWIRTCESHVWSGWAKVAWA